MTWAGGVALGVALAAVVIVPLAVELTKSPVWSDRAQERPSPWRLTRPRILEAACTALPYLYGSQRRDQPHLGHAVGVHNLNESAGGFAGLATLIWLAPLALSARREIPFVGYLAGLTTIGALAAFGIPPVANLLRVLPVLDVTDNRRLTLWVAFGLVLLGGIGLDRLADDRARHPRTILWAIGAILLATTAFGVTQLGPRLRERARTHYANAASRNPAADPRVYQARADAQTAKTLAFVPRYYAAAAGQLLLLAGLAEALRRRMLARAFVRPAIVGVVMLDLFAFGYGLNPAIARADDRPISPVVAYLQREVGERGRVLGLSEELPPNVAMRYGLKDIRNYDSVEIARSLAWFAPVYSQGARARTSRREITWEGVVRARERLRQASVCAVVSATPPPPGAFERVDKVGNAWIARLDGMPWASSQNGGKSIYCDQRNGYIESNVSLAQDDRILLRETYDPGWRATIDGVPVGVEPYLSTFLAVRVPSGMHRLQLHYDPPEVRLALAISGFALVLAVFALTDSRPFRSTRIIFRRLGRIRAIELESV